MRFIECEHNKLKIRLVQFQTCCREERLPRNTAAQCVTTTKRNASFLFPEVTCVGKYSFVFIVNQISAQPDQITANMLRTLLRMNFIIILFVCVFKTWSVSVRDLISTKTMFNRYNLKCNHTFKGYVTP